ncbi:MAG: HlyD family efflux transporter periplasmic adaptor subunit [Eubacteriales bacterium]|nr:HlyD family efflux transporter periplasmic adaptor subunit [Eubacteriales bacterium]
MKSMKLLSLLAAASLLFGETALAAEDLTGRPIADGVVAAAVYTDVTAPFSGTLTAFDLEAGDTVQVAQGLFRYITNDLYASEDGIVKAVFIQPGDDAAAVTARYGAVIGIEPTAEYRVAASTAGAASDNANKLLHLGETLYFATSTRDGDEGSGLVTQVSGNEYTVDVLTGTFDLNASVTLYRDDRHTSKSCVGKGTVARRDALLVGGTGRVASVAVKEGDAVKSGELLAAFLSADASPDDYRGMVASPVSGVMRSVAVIPGQQVWKGELLCRIDHTDALEVVADVDEVDLGTLRVGDTLPVTLDMDENTVLIGAVTQISARGVTKQNAAYFTMHVSLPAGSAPLGASASVYLPLTK